MYFSSWFLTDIEAHFKDMMITYALINVFET